MILIVTLNQLVIDIMNDIRSQLAKKHLNLAQSDLKVLAATFADSISHSQLFWRLKRI